MKSEIWKFLKANVEDDNLIKIEVDEEASFATILTIVVLLERWDY